MADYILTKIFNFKGKKIWTGEYNERYKALNTIDKHNKNVALGYILGGNERLDKKAKYSSKHIFKKAIEWEFVDTNNNLPGFVSVLPKAKVLERIIESINAQHFKELNAVEVSFPTFFNYNSKEISNLTKTYEVENRMFKLHEDEKEIRAAYAADPGLLLWLKNKTFKNDSLPYAVYTQTQVFRKFKKGELYGFPQLREFPMPDLHIICKKSDAVTLYKKNLAIAAKNMRFLLKEDWAFSIDVTSDLYATLGDFFIDICKILNKVCVINILRKKPRYYDMKSVFMMDAGDCAIMNFNMQWDRENPILFNINNENRDELIILHATLMHSWYKILPVFINQMLINNDQKLPYHIAPIQISIIPVSLSYIDLAQHLENILIERSVRCAIVTNKDKLSKTIKMSNKNHTPYFIIVGEEERLTSKFNVTCATNRNIMPLEKFINEKNIIHNMVSLAFWNKNNVLSPFII